MRFVVGSKQKEKVMTLLSRKAAARKYQLIARVQMEDWPKLAVSAN